MGANLVFAVSDATAQLAYNLAYVATLQFGPQEVAIRRFPRITTELKLQRVFDEAKKSKALIVASFASHLMREKLVQFAASTGIVTIDMMGPLLEKLSSFLGGSPSNQAGIQYYLTEDYYRRSEAIEFTVKHDDSIGLSTLSQADIIILGISRTSKTPLSIFLGHHGFKVANVPIVSGVPIPEELWKSDTKKMVGLTILPEKLLDFRMSRLSKMGRPLPHNYASLEKIEEELAYARKVFSELGNIPVIDVTTKAIEETAGEILAALGKDISYQTT
ncbi:MAG: kinase/pyrophosphorylase [Deltaproteobacteria bacterium]|nr:kinase/pyrophosphorylase [Deltaproteobacteria bacterium]